MPPNKQVVTNVKSANQQSRTTVYDVCNATLDKQEIHVPNAIRENSVARGILHRPVEIALQVSIQMNLVNLFV